MAKKRKRLRPSPLRARRSHRRPEHILHVVETRLLGSSTQCAARRGAAGKGIAAGSLVRQLHALTGRGEDDRVIADHNRRPRSAWTPISASVRSPTQPLAAMPRILGVTEPLRTSARISTRLLAVPLGASFFSRLMHFHDFQVEARAEDFPPLLRVEPEKGCSLPCCSSRRRRWESVRKHGGCRRPAYRCDRFVPMTSAPLVFHTGARGSVFDRGVMAEIDDHIALRQPPVAKIVADIDLCRDREFAGYPSRRRSGAWPMRPFEPLMRKAGSASSAK